MDTSGRLPINSAVAAELRAYRGAAKVTFDLLVKETGISRSTLLRIFDGKRDINVEQLYRLGEALNFEVATLIDRAYERQRSHVGRTQDAEGASVTQLRPNQQAAADMSTDELEALHAKAAIVDPELDTDESDPT